MTIAIKDIKNSTWLGIQFGVTILTSFIGIKLNLLTFGEVQFSSWILLLSMWGVGTVLDMGFGISTIKFVAQYRDDNEKTNAILSTSFFIFLLLGLLIFAIGYAVAELLYFTNPKLFDPDSLHAYRMVCLALGANFYFNYLAIFFRGIFEGMNQFKHSVFISMAGNLTTFCAVFFIYLLNLSLLTLALCYTASALLQLGLFIFFFKRQFQRFSIAWRLANSSTFNELFKFSMSVQITYFLGALIDPLIKYIIGTFSDIRLIPQYEIANKFSHAIMGLFSVSFKNMLPKISRLKTRTQNTDFIYQEVSGLSRFSIFYSALTFGFCSIIFLLLFKYFYRYDECIIIFMILALVNSTVNFSYMAYIFMIGIGKTPFLIITQVINLTFISIFLPLGFDMANSTIGFFGYYIAVMVSSAVMVIYLRKLSDIEIGAYLKQSRVVRLFLFHGITLIHIFLLLSDNINTLYYQFGYAVICLAVFGNELKGHLYRFSQIIFNRTGSEGFRPK